MGCHLAVCPVLHGTRYSILVFLSPHTLFRDDVINFRGLECHLYAVFVPSTSSLTSGISSPTTYVVSPYECLRDISDLCPKVDHFISFSPLLLCFSTPSFYLSPGCHHLSPGLQIHLCPPLPHSPTADKVIFQNVNQLILFHCLLVFDRTSAQFIWCKRLPTTSMEATSHPSRLNLKITVSDHFLTILSKESPHSYPLTKYL